MNKNSIIIKNCIYDTQYPNPFDKEIEKIKVITYGYFIMLIKISGE